ncbi:MAG TPA: hypothetical protein VG145_05830 [Xanthobacteraceae bacterium]|jgi:hypothetical protein|nr:hypothetical protein [Xanthobacteraceae bacterium]
MASMFDRAVEASFKPVPGGYEFRRPNPWLFGLWRTYLVNEAQKEVLAAFVRRRQRLILGLLAIYLMLGAAATVSFQALGGPPDLSPAQFATVVVVAMVGMLMLALVPHVYLMRKIEPLLAELPRTDDQTTFHQQLFGVAAVISPVHLALGGIGGFLIAASNVKGIADLIAQGAIGSELFWPGFGLLIGFTLASYFAYLTVLRRRLKRGPN